MAWTPLDETISAGQPGHITDHQTYHEWANNDFDIGWGVGWVHPTGGASSYDGSNRRFPKDTIPNAISAGYRIIHVGPGVHTVSSLTDECSLIFHPGTHTFSNAPVTTDYAVTLKGLNPIPDKESITGAAWLTASSTVDSIFRIGRVDLANYPRGTYVGDLFFNMVHPTVAALDCINVNYATIENNVFRTAASTWTDTPAIRSYDDPSGVSGDQSWNRYHRNWAIGCPVLYVEQGWNWVNRNVISDNVGKANGVNGTSPYLEVNGRAQGLDIRSNHFQDLAASATAAIHLYGQQNGHYLIGNSFANINTTNNIAILLDDIAASIIIHNRGYTTGNGELRLINIIGETDRTYSGEWNYVDAQKNRIIVQDRYDNT